METLFQIHSLPALIEALESGRKVRVVITIPSIGKQVNAEVAFDTLGVPVVDCGVKDLTIREKQFRNPMIEFFAS